MPRPSHVFDGDTRGARGVAPNVRPPKYAPMSQATVPTRTHATMPPPCGRSRRSTACAMAMPIHATPSTQNASPGPVARGVASVTANSTGKNATNASITVSMSPSCAATTRPMTPRNPASFGGPVCS